MVARVWGPQTYAETGHPFPDCSRCRDPRSAEMRERWGCDRAADRPVFQIGCSACAGENPECVQCQGLGKVDQYRCPTALVKSAPALTQVHLDLLIRCYVHYEARHALPVGGGLLEQSRSFLAACEIIDAERGRLTALVEAKRERDQRAAAARAKQAQRGRR